MLDGIDRGASSRCLAMLSWQCDQRSMFRGAAESQATRVRCRPGSESRRLRLEAGQAAAQIHAARRSQSGALDFSVVGRLDLRGNDGHAVTGERRAGAMVMRDPQSRPGQAARIGHRTPAGENLDGRQVPRQRDWYSRRKAGEGSGANDMGVNAPLFAHRAQLLVGQHPA
jgi:hypothetical protein